jgi:hypothetical protein
MKRITNKSLQTALLRGAVLVSGSMATIITTLFFDSIYGVAVTLCLGAGIIALIDEVIVTNQKNIQK